MKKVLDFLEKMFLFSPVLVVLISIFNFTDTKSFVSRLSAIVIVYSVVRYRNTIKTNFQNQSFRKFLYSSLLISFYFTIMHFWRGDNFGFPRTLLTSIAYLLVIPWERIPRSWLYSIIVVSAYICGFNALYEHFEMNIGRVGIATNPIPYALYCAFLSLSSLYLTKVYLLKWQKCIAIAGSIIALIALVLTDVRGVWVAYPFILFYVLLNLFPRFSIFKIIMFSLLSVGCLYLAFKPALDVRFNRTISEFNTIMKGNYQTSIGVRLDLWKYGFNKSKEVPIFGMGDEALESGIKTIPNRLASKQPHLHNQYIDTLSRYGVLGVIFLLGWLASTFYGSSRTDEPYALTKILVSLILIASLTDIPFHHTHLVYLFSLIVGSLILTAPLPHQVEKKG
ncbi:O-antigen ligase family protein [Vibrio sp. RE86]|uniref:O-antigen ligase family protein n=1 Tax=Vibrio sp. RE86 TaxID=2607605 RepID=UPI001493356E|nr:O-antigen ligase family protein [Vibrio sp. RE86]NOH80829.1 O-antigen ligase family protein [Vibrio sp. RE86]